MKILCFWQKKNSRSQWVKNQNNQHIIHEIASKYTNIKLITTNQTTNKSANLLHSNEPVTHFLFGGELKCKHFWNPMLLYTGTKENVYLQSVIISSPHALQAYDDGIGHHRPAMRPESL